MPMPQIVRVLGEAGELLILIREGFGRFRSCPNDSLTLSLQNSSQTIQRRFENEHVILKPENLWRITMAKRRFSSPAMISSLASARRATHKLLKPIRIAAV